MIASEKAERLLVALVNYKFPDEDPSASIPRLRAITEKHWPDLWGWIGESAEEGELRAQHILRKIRFYLRQFWESSNEHARDWYIHRLRQYHHRHLMQPNTQEVRSALNRATTADEARALAAKMNKLLDEALDTPPVRTPFEESLFHLQGIAHKLRQCRNKTCKFSPYFIEEPESKNAGYCCDDCRNAGRRESKRRWWSDNHAKRKGQKQ